MKTKVVKAQDDGKELKYKKAHCGGVKKVANVFWFIFPGWLLALSEIFTGVGLCATLIFIPLGIQHFKMIRLCPKPFGRDVVTRFKAHPIINALYFIFGGVELAIVQTAISLVFAITIVGLPVAKQIIKFAKFNLAPFGADIVEEGVMTKTKDTAYDFYTLLYRVNADPDRIVSTPDKGNVTASKYICDLAYEDDDILKAYKRSFGIKRILAFLLLAFFVLTIVALAYGEAFIPPQYMYIPAIVFGVVLLIVVINIIFSPSIPNKVARVALKKLLFLTESYNDNSDYAYPKRSNNPSYFPVKFIGCVNAARKSEIDAKKLEKEKQKRNKK